MPRKLIQMLKEFSKEAEYRRYENHLDNNETRLLFKFILTNQERMDRIFVNRLSWINDRDMLNREHTNILKTIAKDIIDVLDEEIRKCEFKSSLVYEMFNDVGQTKIDYDKIAEYISEIYKQDKGWQ